jgi:hypothetical protein
MARVKLVFNWWIPIVLITVALMTPAIAQAGSIKIWPDQLIPQVPNKSNPYEQLVSWVSNNSFYAPLTLPSGATIVKITYYHVGMNPEALTTFSIWRIKMGTFGQMIGEQTSTDSTTVLIPVNVPITGDPIIRAGYRYFLQVFVNGSSYIYGVKITYQ